MEELVAGRYQLRRLVGAGGMGRVWLARDEILQRDVAVKEVVPVDTADRNSAEVWARTTREARAAARLSHPNVVPVFDVLRTAGRAWIVMEFIPGRSLEAAVREQGGLGVRAAARIGLALLDALDAAHRAGILHRDVKPGNVLLADDGRVLLGDFGLAVSERDAVTGSAGEPVYASPPYVAPERAADGVSSRRTDMWSLGATLYWAVEGRPPYSRDGIGAQLAALAAEPPDPVSRAGALAPVLTWLLQRDAADRPGPAQTRAALQTVLAADPAQNRRPQGHAPRPRPGRFTRRAGALVAAVTVVAAVAAGGVVARAAEPAPHATFVAGSPAPATPSCASPDIDRPDAFRPDGPVTATTGPATLPAGWIWHREDRFTVGVPRGWLHATDGRRVCLTDPVGRRGLTVDQGAAPIADRVAYWQSRERQLLQRGAPPGYRRIAIGPIAVGKGAADWEYTYDDGGLRWHVLHRAVSFNGKGRTDAAFVVSWLTPDETWAAQQSAFNAAVKSFEAR